MRLILFSGGVESTALCTMANHNDILLVSDRVHDREGGIWHEESARAIANYFGLGIERFTMSGPPAQQWVHQRYHLFSVAHIVVSRNPAFTEVWYGANSSHADESERSREYSAQVLHDQAWKILHPTVKYSSPLEHLTKRQQWNLIPDQVKPMVVTCTQQFHNYPVATPPTISFENITIRGCGRCGKCREFDRFVISAA